ncbi:MAG: hypothetical protein A2499_16010 [Stygiobacter sp. RIFOXYC12_FULL_38_8]|nr:MAG: hypothetical protein A2279_05160 [Stygiobacter sp. RIFOXYA12_FULL_38_9]OGV06235.1 MAG: hypothetical protein A2299_12435 [Stygiobacter sp. RIFOXYB2_FULL_37_11]OGV14336.1 MAG: hypothetical protein A2237_12955 [Stygiobacter sp. RIFOXYA2_FULL_38_8]OGV15986.1 MAG: hypothetical protein A2440_03365 [Stygiobacter sp. RIFOXYC2_FULL_38_25]OGV23818.1 MAG: hypothetical protein A2499_16010 [Stygiobacter sp. RIFOXYC12_FULL_38_8]OGV80463.1 MAG: hypothetical protein A2X65_04525 [Stygiobacter sp. GWF2_
MTSLDIALESARQLSLSEKEMLIEILMKQTIEERRKEIAGQVKEAETLYASGKITASNSEHIIGELHDSLTEPDED